MSGFIEGIECSQSSLFLNRLEDWVDARCEVPVPAFYCLELASIDGGAVIGI